MRIAPQMPRVEPDQRRQLGDDLAALGGIANTVDDEWLADDIGHGHARVERTERVLEDELHAAAELL